MEGNIGLTVIGFESLLVFFSICLNHDFRKIFRIAKILQTLL